jgi:hypothetical protein
MSVNARVYRELERTLERAQNAAAARSPSA